VSVPKPVAPSRARLFRCGVQVLRTVAHDISITRLLTRFDSIVSQLASLLDLNTLHDLSRTCRQFRANLLQYRTMLKTLTLRCVNETPNLTTRAENELHDFNNPNVYRTKHASRRITSGKVGPCARDMVAECRKCSQIVCRV
jgi:hypothetical protein